MEQILWNPYLEGGKYRNPILYADYSDPDVIRVGEDYYMTASSFSNLPGLPILHSRDLVGWRVIGYGLDRIPYDEYDRPVHGHGVWAPAIRYHGGQFWIFYSMPDEGIFFVTAKNPAGPWDPPVLLKEAKGWIDPCPFWDQDGRAYLVHGFAKSRSGIKSQLQLFEMAPDGSALLGEGRIIFDGHDTQPTIEGPKLYRRGGYYYIFAPAGSVPHGWQTVLRSQSLWGPYEEKIVMMRGDSDVNGPHQGGWVDTPSGEDWFLHFQDVGYCGRIVHLQPMKWDKDWPVIGEDRDGEGWGTPVTSWKRPDCGGAVEQAPADSDDFSGSSLGLQWQWNANPKAEWYALEGGLRLYAQPTLSELCDAPNLLLQKFPRPDFSVSTQVDLSCLNEGESLSLVMLSRNYGALTARRTGGGTALEFRSGRIGGPEAVKPLTELPQNSLTLHMKVDAGSCQFFYQTQEAYPQKAGPTFVAEQGVWTGAKVGLHCGTTQCGDEAGGSALVRGFTFGSSFQEKHFCTCPVTQCPRHPGNHHKGCDPCIKDNLEKGKMPACFYSVVHEDVSQVRDFTIKGFVDFYQKHHPAD